MSRYISKTSRSSTSTSKKQFQVTETKKGIAAAAKPQAPPQKKLVFLVFDAAFSPHAMLEKAKTMADIVIAQSDQTAQYVLLTIEPFAGLHYIFGPTRDLKLLEQQIKKYVEGNKPN